jgi:hypothetical protein
MDITDRLTAMTSETIPQPIAVGDLHRFAEGPLTGKPSSATWGLHYRSWGELARARPGLRPCGTCGSIDKPINAETYIVMRPIADLETLKRMLGEG